MRAHIILAVLTIVYNVRGDHLTVGNIATRVEQIHEEQFQYNAIPFMKRIKQFFYTSPDNKIISGIQALDKQHSKSSANITSGGVGYSYVNIRLKSERGRGLDYNIGIYSNQQFP